MNVQFNKLLVLEGDSISNNHFLESLVESLKNNGNVVIIENVYSRLDDVIIELTDADAILFSSTFLYGDKIRRLGDLLFNLPPIKIFNLNHEEGYFREHIEELWTVEELSIFSKHSLYEWIYSEDEPTKLDMNIYVDQWNEVLKEKQNYIENLKPTGLKIKIKDIVAVGEEFSVLNEGDIVDEIDNRAKDPNPKRGVWVMGKTEPIKLLNSDGYDEWEIAEITPYTIVREMYAKINKEIDLNAETLVEWLRNSHNMDDGYIWEWVTDFCDENNIERRKNRQFFYDRIKSLHKNLQTN